MAVRGKGRKSGLKGEDGRRTGKGTIDTQFYEPGYVPLPLPKRRRKPVKA